MSAFMMHKKELERWNTIAKILNNSEIKDMRKAKETYSANKANIRKLKNFNTILSNGLKKQNTNDNKTTHFNLCDKTVGLVYPIEGQALLSYSLDSLSSRRLFPQSIASLINNNINKDISKNKNNAEEISNVAKFLKNFCSSYNLSVNRIQADKNNGIFTFETTQRDNICGSTYQYINIVLDKNKKFELDTISDNLNNLSLKYSSLLSFFSLFGFGDIYSRCTCKNYNTKYTSRKGMQNYCCSHILYSMLMFPYYLVTLLSSA